MSPNHDANPCHDGRSSCIGVIPSSCVKLKQLTSSQLFTLWKLDSVLSSLKHIFFSLWAELLHYIFSSLPSLQSLYKQDNFGTWRLLVFSFLNHCSSPSCAKHITAVPPATFAFTVLFSCGFQNSELRFHMKFIPKSEGTCFVKVSCRS